MRQRKSPFANPDRVSTREYLNSDVVDPRLVRSGEYEECVDLPKGENVVQRPVRHDTCEKSHRESEAIKEHVNCCRSLVQVSQARSKGSSRQGKNAQSEINPKLFVQIPYAI